MDRTHGAMKPMDKNSKVAIIGYGRMGSSLIKGILKSGTLCQESIMVYDINENRLALANEEGLITTTSLSNLRSSDVIILTVKPKDMPPLLEAIKDEFRYDKKPLVISIAAGVRLSYIESKLWEGSRVIRVMPNIAAQIKESASVFVRNKNVTGADLVFVRSLLEGIGLAFMVEDESLLDIVTGISGSGPAYFFLLMKLMVEIGKKYGLDPELAKMLVAQTCKGAGELVLRSRMPFDQLIMSVVSPGGTTEEALKVLKARGLEEIFSEAISAAIEKSKKMSYS